MTKISDEIREFVRRSYADEHMDPRELLALADRVDAEMVELPRDAGGVPIHIGDKMHDPLGHYWWQVHSLHLYDEICSAWRVNADKSPRELTHTAPDSWGRIADELEKLSESNRVNGSGEVFYRAGDLAERVRELAAKED